MCYYFCMRSKNARFNSINKFSPLLIIGIIIVAITGWWAFGKIAFPAQSYPLGDKIDYVGKTDYGTIPFLSDSEPGATYHYATDMTPPEIAGYFTDATIAQPEKIADWQNQGPDFMIDFTSNKSGYPFSVYFHADGKEHLNGFGLSASKRYSLSVDSHDYETAKNSL